MLRDKVGLPLLHSAEFPPPSGSGDELHLPRYPGMHPSTTTIVSR